VLAEYEPPSVDLSKDVLFTDFMEEWLETLMNSKSIYPTTYDGYKLIMNSHIIPYFKPLKIKVRDLTPAHIQKYVNDKMKTLSPNTVIKHLHNISKCLNSAVRQNIILFNPSQRIEKPQKIKYTGAKYFNETQIERLLAAVKGDILETIILFAIFYGLRRSEILGLKWDAIDMENDVLTIKHTVIRVNKTMHKNDLAKTKSSYGDMPVPSVIKQNLRNIMQKQAEDKLKQNDYKDEGYVFTHDNGKIIHPNYVTKRFAKLLEKNGFPHIRFHDLRHSSAVYLKYLGFDMKDIQTWLRHGDIGTTMNIYVNLDMEAKRHIAGTLDGKFKNFDS
jgi:integrase